MKSTDQPGSVDLLNIPKPEFRKEDYHTKGPLAKSLEQVIKNAETAINARDFTLPSPHCWDNWSTHNLKSSWSHASLVSASANHATGIEEFLNVYRGFVKTYPEYAIKIGEMDTHVRQKGTRADVFANAEVHGAPPGVVRTMVVVFEFAFLEDEDRGKGRWLAVKMQGMPGMDELSGE